MLWIKSGKLLTIGGKLCDSDHCPCNCESCYYWWKIDVDCGIYPSPNDPCDDPSDSSLGSVTFMGTSCADPIKDMTGVVPTVFDQWFKPFLCDNTFRSLYWISLGGICTGTPPDDCLCPDPDEDAPTEPDPPTLSDAIDMLREFPTPALNNSYTVNGLDGITAVSQFISSPGTCDDDCISVPWSSFSPPQALPASSITICRAGNVCDSFPIWFGFDVNNQTVYLGVTWARCFANQCHDCTDDVPCDGDGIDPTQNIWLLLFFVDGNFFNGGCVWLKVGGDDPIGTYTKAPGYCEGGHPARCDNFNAGLNLGWGPCTTPDTITVT